jgi:hypothetical protein
MRLGFSSSSVPEMADEDAYEDSIWSRLPQDGDLIALQGRAKRMVPTPFKVINEIRHARNLVSAWAGGGEEWW